MLRVAFDVGGVLSKYPILVQLLKVLGGSPDVEVHVISDMHPQDKILAMLALNDLNIDPSRVHSADYTTHGEDCKKIKCEELEIDILIDDFIGYVAAGKHIRFLVMPNSEFDYYHPDWKTDGTEGNFGRRRQK